MGLNFRKSIKIGKNTKINLSKTGGIGISTGVKGARVSVNQKGVGTQVGKDGIYYRKDCSLKPNNNPSVESSEEIIGINNTKPVKIQDAIEHSEELKKILLKVRILIGIQYISALFGFINLFRQSDLLAFIFLFVGIIAFVINIGSKHGYYNGCLNSVVNFANANQVKFAKKYLNKAKKINNSVIVQELENIL